MAADAPMKISVVVPSFRRPESLRMCLSALGEQRRPADELVVVTRQDDRSTRSLIDAVRREHTCLRETVVDAPGLIRALIAGSDAASGDVIAFTDDDAAPRRDWLEHIEEWFWDPTVDGVGGRDVIAHARHQLRKAEVGRVRLNGKVIGNHHLGKGFARDVDVLKGVNMAFRDESLRSYGFDERLKGEGAGVNSELKLCLDLRRGGGRLVYDPNLVVDHMPAERLQGDLRDKPSPKQQAAAVHNETLALLDFLPRHRQAVFAIWALAVGTRAAPGVAHIALSIFRQDPPDFPRLLATLRGRWSAWQTYRAANSASSKRHSTIASGKDRL